jgi:hypothetical protein
VKVFPRHMWTYCHGCTAPVGSFPTAVWTT